MTDTMDAIRKPVASSAVQSVSNGLLLLANAHTARMGMERWHLVATVMAWAMLQMEAADLPDDEMDAVGELAEAILEAMTPPPPRVLN